MSEHFVQPYTALLVLLTQDIALRTVFSGAYTLTFVQDSAIAWTGLGAALLSLVKPQKSRSHVAGLVQTVTYLSGVSVLHITTPSLFSWRLDLEFVEEVQTIAGLPLLNAS